jgi:hypothetical protein
MKHLHEYETTKNLGVSVVFLDPETIDVYILDSLVSHSLLFANLA